MSKVMVMLAEGFEEVEALTVVDVLRRADVQCDMVSISSSTEVLGAHGISVKADVILDKVNSKEYDGIVLPGGMPGAVNLRNDIAVVEIVKDFYASGKITAAICAAPIVLEKAGIVDGKKITSYPSFKDKFEHSLYTEDVVAVDNNLITSRGPATALSFSYEILKALGKGKEVEELKDGMLFDIMFK